MTEEREAGRDPAAQLWAKDLPLDELVHRFTCGDDPRLDLQLLPWDCLGSAAHARMLAGVGLLGADEARALVDALRAVAREAAAGTFTIRPEQEDGHTALEAELTRRLGAAGRRVHLGRSRNDQVALALRLLMRDALLDLGQRTARLADVFLSFARHHADQPLPGYTHLRRAMPSSWGQWGQAHAEGLAEELRALPAVYARLDRCPLGAAAGFGAPLALDREDVAERLGFAGVQRSPVDVINSRGRHEQALLDWLCSVAFVLEKAMWDVALFTTEEFGFLRLPDAFTTGSSIMPQKRNPDVVELARAGCGELRGWAAMLREIAVGLPGNYHRDLQLLKKPLLGALGSAGPLLDVAARVVDALEVDAEASRRACTPDLYAADRALGLAAAGLPFRDAYRQVARELGDGSFTPDPAARSAHTGGLANLGLDDTAAELAAARAWLDARQDTITRAQAGVWNDER